MAIRDVGGIDVLINLLDTDEPKCKVQSSHKYLYFTCLTSPVPCKGVSAVSAVPEIKYSQIFTPDLIASRSCRPSSVSRCLLHWFVVHCADRRVEDSERNKHERVDPANSDRSRRPDNHGEDSS